MRAELLAATKDQNAIRKRWAERLLRKLDAGEKFAASYPYPLHAWRLGKETLILGMGAETVVDYALRFKTEFGRGTWVCGYTDDMISYIPSRRVWAEGGYEGGSNLYEYGRPALRLDRLQDLFKTRAPRYCVLTAAEWKARPAPALLRLLDEQGDPIVLARIEADSSIELSRSHE